MKCLGGYLRYAGLFLPLLTTMVFATSPADTSAPQTFKASPDYAKATRGALLDQFDLYAKMTPATMLGQTHGWARVMGVQGKDDSAWLWADPAYNSVPTAAEILAGKHLAHSITKDTSVAVYFVGEDGHEIPLDTPNRAMRAWEAAITDQLTQDQALICSDNGSTGNGFDYPLAGQMGSFGMVAMAGASEDQFNLIVKTRLAAQSPEAMKAEQALLAQETATLGEVEAKKRATARLNVLKSQEEGLLRWELAQGHAATSTPLLQFIPQRDLPLKDAAIKHRQDMADEAAKDVTPIPQRWPWVLVAYFEGVHQAGNPLFPKSACTGELVLFQDGKPMLAARQTTLVSARTAGGASAMGQNGGALSATLKHGLD